MKTTINIMTLIIIFVCEGIMIWFDVRMLEKFNIPNIMTTTATLAYLINVGWLIGSVNLGLYYRRNMEKYLRKIKDE